MLLLLSEDLNTSCIHKSYVKDPVYYPEYSKMCEVAVPNCSSLKLWTEIVASIFEL